MLENFAFTLYEIFGYLLPGAVSLVGLMLLYWALFVPEVPLGIATLQPGFGTWTAIVVASYVLGHAAQAAANILLRSVERRALAMHRDAWMREYSQQRAAQLTGIPQDDLEPRWIYRILDEYAVQTGKAGDRDVFIYPEGFYRGTCISLFFLAAALVVRVAFPGTSIQLTRWLLRVSTGQLLTTTGICAGLGFLFLERYRRFTDYRITRAVLCALVLQRTQPKDPEDGKPQSPVES
jgi:hypothetical protein